MSRRSNNEDEPTTAEILIGIFALIVLFCFSFSVILCGDYWIFEWILKMWIALLVLGVIWGVIFFPFSD